MYLSRIGNVDFLEVCHKIVDIRHLHVHGVDTWNFAEDQLRHLEHGMLKIKQ